MQIKQSLYAETALICYDVDFDVRDDRGWTFSLEKRYELWTRILTRSNSLKLKRS